MVNHFYSRVEVPHVHIIFCCVQVPLCAFFFLPPIMSPILTLEGLDIWTMAFKINLRFKALGRDRIREILKYIIQPINACMTYIIKFNITTIYTVIFQNKYTHIITSFANYMTNTVPIMYSKISPPIIYIKEQY